MMLARLRSTALGVATAAAVSLPIAFLQERDEPATQEPEREAMVQLYYLEIVTPDMDETCELLAELHGVEFGEPQPALGNARTTVLADDGRIGVRKPMHAAENTVVRPYVLVEDVDAAFAKAKEAGAQIMMPPTKNADGGRFCLYTLGGIEHGIWER